MLPSSSELDAMLDAALLGCSLATGALILCGIFGFFLVVLQGTSIFRGCQFALMTVILALVTPFVCAAATYAAYAGQSSFVENALKTDGVVVRLVEGESEDGGTVYSAIVEYTPIDATEPIQFEDNSEACNPACKEVGEEVTVIYDPTDPTRAQIDSLLSRWVWTGVFALMTVIFLLIAVGYIWKAYRTGEYWSLFDDITT